jgi:hypothetical protein
LGVNYIPLQTLGGDVGFFSSSCLYCSARGEQTETKGYSEEFVSAVTGPCLAAASPAWIWEALPLCLQPNLAPPLPGKAKENLLLLDPAQNGIARKLDPLLPSCHHHSQHFAFVVPVRSKQATGTDQISSFKLLPTPTDYNTY